MLKLIASRPCIQQAQNHNVTWMTHNKVIMGAYRTVQLLANCWKITSITLLTFVSWHDQTSNTEEWQEGEWEEEGMTDLFMITVLDKAGNSSTFSKS